jgi:hypothetical protein
MATVNLGRIKPVFRGAYAGGTAYVVDDIVTSGNETFICIQASTGNATSSASYWTKLAAKGTDGTDGTDVGTTLTTQGDMLYRDGSGLQRLAKGTAAQILQMNSGANAPEWTAKPGGGILQMKETVYHNLHGANHSTFNIFNANFNVAITPTKATSKFLLEASLFIGLAHHDVGGSFGFMDSQVGTSGDNNVIHGLNNQGSSEYGSRTPGNLGAVPCFGSDASPDDHWQSSIAYSTLYTPSSQNTNQRLFYPSTKRNSDSYNILLNYGQVNSGRSMAGMSVIRVSEIDSSIT